MFIRKLDLLSSPPQMHILKEETNKTFFGGILFIIYIIVMIIVSIIYILDYALNDKYSIRYSLYRDFTNKEKNNNKKEDLNPHLNFTLNIKKIGTDFEEVNIDDELLIFDSNLDTLKKNSIISRTPSDFAFVIYDLCEENCNDKLAKLNNESIFYVLNITYSGYKIDHNNKNTPLERNNDKYTFYKELIFSLDKSSIIQINWNVIKYKEERGIFSLFDNLLNVQNEFTSIDIDNVEQIETEKLLIMEEPEIPLKMRVFAMVNMTNSHNQYIEYVRTEKLVLEVLADIGSLFSTFYSVFYFIYNFYSQNFDNYKIVNEVLTINDKNRKSLKRISRISRINSLKIDVIPLKTRCSEMDVDNICSVNSFKSLPNTSRKIDPKQKEEIKITENNVNKLNKSKRIKLIHFLLENIYCKKNNIKNEYKIIKICNKILSKFLSIESILYNQIMFENLLKDYQWNENNLRIIENNYLIKKLKLLIKT